MFNLFHLKKIFGRRVKAAPRPKPRPTDKPRLEWLEERLCLDATTDTLVWAPTDGIVASKSANWYDQTQGKQNVTAPTATNPIVLDGAKSNEAIDFTAAMPVASLTVRNGYQGTLFTDAGAVTTSANDTINSGCTLTLISKAVSGGIVMTNGANFTVAAGGTLKLTDAMGTTQGVTFLSAKANNAGEYLSNAGTVIWTGTAVASGKPLIIDTLGAPVLNTGTFIADGGTNGNTTVDPGQLLITGQEQNKTNNVSFDQTSGTCQLRNGARVATEFGYYQSGGSLTSDFSTGNQACRLSGGIDGLGDINIAGGKVVVGLPPTPGQVGVGTLLFKASTAEINGEIDVDGETSMGGKSELCDLLDCTAVGTVTLQANSSLNVGTTGSAPLGTGNQWTVMTYPMNALKGTWTQLSYPADMTVSIGAQKVLVSN